MQLQCVKCAFTAPSNAGIVTCPHHNQYYSYLEVADCSRDFFSLYGEGNTPIHFLPTYSSAFRTVYVKDESINPTGSVKDREVAGIFRHVINEGIKEISMVSASNGARAAAYFAARAKITLHCFLSKKTSKDTIEYLEHKGAIIHLEDGDYEDIFKRIIDSNPYYNITPGINPFAEEGTKFIGHELLSQVLDISAVVVPVGNGTQIAGIWKGFKELHTKRLPGMIGVEIEGCDPVYQAYKNGDDFVELNVIPHTKADGIAARCAFTSPKAIRALKESNGMIVRITERELKSAMSAVEGGLFPACSYTSASVFAALSKISIDGNIVCILSGKNHKK